MSRLRRIAAPLLTMAAVSTTIAAGTPAHAQRNAPSLIGKWSSEESCGAQSRQIVFRGSTMELWEQNQRLFTGSVRFQNTGNETAVTVVSIGRETPRIPGNPEVGDVATFRRDGSRMHPLRVMRGSQRRVAPSDTPPFYLCPS